VIDGHESVPRQPARRLPYIVATPFEVVVRAVGERDGQHDDHDPGLQTRPSFTRLMANDAHGI